MVKKVMGRMDSLREASGSVDFSDTLTTFLYFLIRDHLPSGKVEDIIQIAINSSETVSFTNGFLAQYADNLAGVLKSAKSNSLQDALEDAFNQSEAEEMEMKKATDIRARPRDYYAKLTEGKNQIAEQVDTAIEEADETELKQAEEALEIAAEEDVVEIEIHGCPKSVSPAEEVLLAFSTLDGIKKFMPTNNVKQVVDILKDQMNKELSAEMRERVEAETSSEADIEIDEMIADTLTEVEPVDIVGAEPVKNITVNRVPLVVDLDSGPSRGTLTEVRSMQVLSEALERAFDPSDVELAVVKTECACRKEHVAEIRNGPAQTIDFEERGSIAIETADETELAAKEDMAKRDTALSPEALANTHKEDLIY